MKWREGEGVIEGGAVKKRAGTEIDAEQLERVRTW